jgi:hypothetical protein
MEVLDASENSASLYSFSTLGSTEECYYDAATEFDTSSEELEDRAENALWELEEGCDLQLLHLLPMEILNRVLAFCSPTTLCHLGRCSTQTLVLTSQGWLWRDLMLRQWGADLASGVLNKRRAEYEAVHGKVESPKLKATASLSDLSLQMDHLSQLSHTSNKSSGSSSLLDFLDCQDLELKEHGTASWEDWKFWYRDVHRAARLTKFDVKRGIRDLIDKHGLPNTTGAIARLLKCSMLHIASFALRDFLHLQAHLNVTSFFLRLWNLKGLSVLQMMRLVLGFIRLPRSDSSLTRIVEILALAWWEQNAPDSELESHASAASPSSPSSSPPASTDRNPLLQQLAEANTAGGEDRRRNTARLMQPLYMAPLSELDATNPWEQYKVPVHLTTEDLRPRGGFYSPDAVSTLCFAILMLETDQRTSAVKMKMSESSFFSQSKGLNSGHNYPREMLRETYNSIKFHPLVLFSDRVASGRIQVHTSVTRFLWLSSKSTTHLRAEVKAGYLKVWDVVIPDVTPIHTIPLDAASTIIRCDSIGPSWITTNMGTDDNTWNTVEIESLSVHGSTIFKFNVPAEQTQKWFSALHWNLHASVLESRAPSAR